MYMDGMDGMDGMHGMDPIISHIAEMHLALALLICSTVPTVCTLPTKQVLSYGE